MFTLYTKANSLTPANQFQVADANILCNNVILPKEIDAECGFNPHNVRLWVIGHNFGVVCAVWASSEQEALDEACDNNMMEHCMLSEDEASEYYKECDENFSGSRCIPLGNAGEWHNLDDCYMAEVDFQLPRDIALVLKFVRAVENQKDSLDF